VSLINSPIPARLGEEEKRYRKKRVETGQNDVFLSTHPAF